MTISALQEGNNKYDAANAARTFKVDKAAAQIHLNNLSQVYDGNPKFRPSTTTPAGLQIEYLLMAPLILQLMQGFILSLQPSMISIIMVV
ncbi:MAG: hypothetical protein IPI77_18365 [Saprospiraceae bacterium]|nr:hypothetical protein [Saprospiraceae bacterium]